MSSASAVLFSFSPWTLSVQSGGFDENKRPIQHLQNLMPCFPYSSICNYITRWLWYCETCITFRISWSKLVWQSLGFWSKRLDKFAKYSRQTGENQTTHQQSCSWSQSLSVLQLSDQASYHGLVPVQILYWGCVQGDVLPGWLVIKFSIRFGDPQ